ncbi:MAG: aminotransferase class I/II-fold pyridoxal phosphate-dependent enzyme [Bacteroidia bacterium]|nr:aminotransferase class I/II-fold pyridoxal phosphate-dependent enzyme [Bacteroidia bacterium]MDW8302806.1 aminotransferase class I/II-fold pyridoxal phosphate-dependent enzyme [Bacteroidia bacterium]
MEITGYSAVAEKLKGSDILKIANRLRDMIAQGERVCNLSVGDFSPKEFQIPQTLKKLIIQSYQNNETNYPPSYGTIELRKAVQAFYKRKFGLEYELDEIQITSGSRPVTHAFYSCTLDPNHTLLYPVPSWNNDLYAVLTQAKEIRLLTKPENGFHPVREELEPHIEKANVLALCSPSNPTGTMFTEKAIRGICELVLQENERRKGKQKPLYVLFDSVYWMLTFGKYKHYNPVVLYPELKNYVVIVDGISKCFAATGVRVGWGLGPKHLISKMTHVIAHAGAWAPRAEQIALAQYLYLDEDIEEYVQKTKQEISQRLNKLYEIMQHLAQKGYPVYAIEPQGAMYLSVQFNLFGKKTPQGVVLQNNSQIAEYLLEYAKLGIVPFQAFGYPEENGWFRLSVGAVSMQDIDWLAETIEKAMMQLN